MLSQALACPQALLNSWGAAQTIQSGILCSYH